MKIKSLLFLTTLNLFIFDVAHANDFVRYENAKILKVDCSTLSVALETSGGAHKSLTIRKVADEDSRKTPASLCHFISSYTDNPEPLTAMDFYSTYSGNKGKTLTLLSLYALDQGGKSNEEIVGYIDFDYMVSIAEPDGN